MPTTLSGSLTNKLHFYAEDIGSYCDYDDIDIFIESEHNSDSKTNHYLHLRLTKDNETNHCYISVTPKLGPDGNDLDISREIPLPVEVFNAFQSTLRTR